MGEGKPATTAHANVPQETIHDQSQWNTGTPKNPGDAITSGIYPDASDKNAHAGDDTQVSQHRASVHHEESVPAHGHDPNPSTYGSMKDGRPASGATANPSKKMDADDTL